jgi:hypothetical protein
MYQIVKYGLIQVKTQFYDCDALYRDRGNALEEDALTGGQGLNNPVNDVHDNIIIECKPL